MDEGEILRLIRMTIRTELAQTLLGSITSTDDSETTSIQRFATDSEIDNLRLIRPSGFASRPKAGVATVVHPVNADPTHLLSLGDYDNANRPEVAEGEAAVYGSSGQAVYTSGTDVIIGDYVLLTGIFLPTKRAAFHADGSFELGILKPISADVTGKVFLGSPSASSPAVLGDVLSNMLAAIITQLTNALTSIATGPIVAVTALPGNPSPTSPAVSAILTTVITQLAAIQAQYLTSPVTNIESQTVFVERL